MQSERTLLKALREPRKAFSIALHRLFAPFGHHNYKKFMVLTRDRTGSNLLIQALNSHPNIAADYEIFGKLHGRAECDILQGCFSRQPFYIRAKGFKIFYYHPQDKESSTIWDLLRDLPDLHVIHLKRSNLLKVEVSSRVAYRSGIYGVRSKKESRAYQSRIEPVTLEPDELRDLFERNREWEAAGERRFKGHPMMELHYEDMTADFDAWYRRVLEFLGIDYKPPRTDFIKQRKKRVRDLVVGYDELKAAFAGTEWAEFFVE